MDNPVEWANSQVQKAMLGNLNKYLDAKQLGEEFWSEIKDKN